MAGLRRMMLSGAVVAGLLMASVASAAGPRHVELVNKDGQWQLLRDGKPYFIKGAGGDASREELVKAGGNSFRTWGADNLGATLDNAEKLGLSVTVGIWLGHERHGFNYSNADQVAKQYEMVREVVMKYKDHPAVLMWGLGNEMEGYAKGDNAAIWSAINNVAALCKKLDPNHPTMTVVAEIGGDRVKNIHRLCPDIDVIGINSYAGGPSIPARYKAEKGTKPYVLTEYGPAGVWEMGRNSVDMVEEPTSTAKAAAYRATYEKGILGAPGLCIGSYVFAWGHKQEATATWFGTHLPDGTKLAAVDTMTEMWSGKAPENRCPEIVSLKSEGPEKLEPGATVTVKLEAKDPEGDPMQVVWELHADSGNYDTGGDTQKATEPIAGAIVSSSVTEAQVKMPSGGKYRLYSYIRDGKGGGAVANVPLFVNGGPTANAKPAKGATAANTGEKVVGKTAKLPFILNGDEVKTLPFIPSGYMGNTKDVAMDEKCEDNPHAGKYCLKVQYNSGKDWAGVVWQSPANDWGEKAGGWDISGATKLTFWARGAKGGEKVKFGFGLIGKDKKFHDSGKGEVTVSSMTTEWKQYTIELKNKDLTHIKSGFYWTLGGSGEPITFYLDDIQFE